jgi:hypothetical protein
MAAGRSNKARDHAVSNPGENQMFRLPSPSFAVCLLALLIALGGAGYSATGGSFILGAANSATSQTRLVAPVAGSAFRIDNTSTAAGASGMTIITNAARPPLAVNSSVKVVNLNADRLDGFDSASFTRTTVVPFNLAAGAVSGSISIPANRPVFVMGVTNTSGERSVGQATLLRAPGALIMWTGLESVAYFVNSSITSGYSSATGGHIVFLDYSHLFAIEVSGPDSVRIHNGAGDARSGTVTFVW